MTRFEWWQGRARPVIKMLPGRNGRRPSAGPACVGRDARADIPQWPSGTGNNQEEYRATAREERA